MHADVFVESSLDFHPNASILIQQHSVILPGEMRYIYHTSHLVLLKSLV